MDLKATKIPVENSRLSPCGGDHRLSDFGGKFPLLRLGMILGGNVKMKIEKRTECNQCGELGGETRGPRSKVWGTGGNTREEQTGVFCFIVYLATEMGIKYLLVGKNPGEMWKGMQSREINQEDGVLEVRC